MDLATKWTSLSFRDGSRTHKNATLGIGARPGWPAIYFAGAALLGEYRRIFLRDPLPLAVRHYSLSVAEMQRGDAELDNLRAALDWAVSSDGDRRFGYALLGASIFVWYHSGQQLEGSERCRRLLPVEGVAPDVEARFQLTLARLGAEAAGPEAYAAAARAAELFRQAHDSIALADALSERAFIGAQRGARHDVALALEEAARVLPRDSPPRLRAALASSHGRHHMMNDELEAALAATARQVEYSREVGGAMTAVHVGLANLAFVESLLGRYDQAIGRLQEVLAEMRRLCEPGVVNALENLALAYGLRAEAGDVERAQSSGREAWKILRQERRPNELPFFMAIALSRSGAAERAALLLGYTDRIWAEDGRVPIPFDVRMRSEIHSASREVLGEQRTTALLAIGAELTDERAAAVAFGSEGLRTQSS